MPNQYIFLVACLVLSIFAGCTNEPVFPVQPKIEFVDIQPKDVREYKDSIYVTFKFQDGDGNLGNDDGTVNLELIDSRTELTVAQATNTFSVLNLTPDAKNPSIQGEITVKIPFTVVIPLPNNVEDTLRYQIKFWDREGNLATPLNGDPDNAIYTDYIRVYKE